MDWWLILIIVICCVIVSLLIILLIIGIFFIPIALKARVKFKNTESEPKVKLNIEFCKETPNEELTIVSHDNLDLFGYLYKRENSHKYIICCHGYRGSCYEHSYIASKFYDLGYNVLLISQRGSGKSDGKYLTMGYLEKFDLLRWIDKLKSLDNECKICLHGWSMGAATAIMCSGLIKDNSTVKCVIADSAYDSIYNQYINVFKTNMKFLPKYSILFTTGILAKLFLKISFKKNSTIDMANKSVLPTLLLHGGTDGFVPTKMIYNIYNQLNIKEKEMYIFSNSTHVMSLTDHEEEYMGYVKTFLEKYF